MHLRHPFPTVSKSKCFGNVRTSIWIVVPSTVIFQTPLMSKRRGNPDAQPEGFVKDLSAREFAIDLDMMHHEAEITKHKVMLLIGVTVKKERKRNIDLCFLKLLNSAWQIVSFENWSSRCPSMMILDFELDTTLKAAHVHIHCFCDIMRIRAERCNHMSRNSLACSSCYCHLTTSNWLSVLGGYEA